MEKEQDMERRIIEAAKIVFIRKGYESTKMGDIAAEVGIGRTALHYYFRTKEMLFDAVLNQLMSAVLPNIDSILNESGNCLQKLPRIIDLYMYVLSANPLFPLFVINEMNRDPEHLFASILKKPERALPLIRLRNQLEYEMEAGILKKQPIIYLVTTLLSLAIFPMIVRNPLTAIFFRGDKEQYTLFLEQRKPFIKEIISQLLLPDSSFQSYQ